MEVKQEHFFPQIHYFDPDFVTLYEQSWARIESQWVSKDSNKNIPSGYLDYEDTPYLDLMDVVSSSFFLLYSNSYFSPTQALDFFYRKQEKNGVIRSAYDKVTGMPATEKGYKDILATPLILWAEYNYYNRTDNKRRLKDIIPKLDAYLQWIISNFQEESGLLLTPKNIMPVQNLPRQNACYLIDFHAQMALAFHYMIKIATYTNHRNLVFKYTKAYYQLKTLINQHFWHAETGFYYDLDEKRNHIKIKTIGSFWTLLALIPNNKQVHVLQKYLNDTDHFNMSNIFPTLSKSSANFSESGNGFLGSIYPFYTYMVIKGLSMYGYHEFARESAIKHISCILATYYSEDEQVQGILWEAYQPNCDLPAKPSSKQYPVRANFFPSVGVSTIAMLIEHIIGFDICLPKKMVCWTIPHLEYMGIESCELKKNNISTIIQRTNRGWEIRHSSEKLYYFSVLIQELNKQKTLPIPSGKCSLLLEKL